MNGSVAGLTAVPLARVVAPAAVRLADVQEGDLVVDFGAGDGSQELAAPREEHRLRDAPDQARRHGEQVRARVIVEHVQDPDVRATREPPVGDVGLPAFVRLLGLEPPFSAVPRALLAAGETTWGASRVARYPIHGATLSLGRLSIRRRRSVCRSTRKTDEVAPRRAHHRSQRKRQIEDAMKTLFTGCVQCGALTTNVEGYCPDCEAARSARRRERRMGQTRVLAPKVRRSSSAHR